MNEILECESCGKVLNETDKYWTSNDARRNCDECMFYPLDVIREVYDFLIDRRIKSAIERIEEFDEEAEGQVLTPEVN